jgi:DNA-binding transcriptional MerR regulator
MPKVLEGKQFYLAHEAAKVAGISKQTLLRWITENRIKDAAKRDRNGWRLFSEPEVKAISRFAQDGT